MDMYRAFLAILISFVILLGYQYFFIGPAQQPEQAEPPTEQAAAPPQPQQQPAAPEFSAPQEQAPPQAGGQQPAIAVAGRPAKEIIIDTNLYTATVSEQGGVITSFLLKNHREDNSKDSPGINLIKNGTNQGYPLAFSWGSAFPQNTLYTLDQEKAEFDSTTNRATVVMRATSPAGLEVTRTYVFNRSEYLISHEVSVVNASGQVLQGSAGLHQKNMPFGALTKASNWLFRGPALYSEAGGLQEFKLKTFEDGPQTVQGAFDWVAYTGTYFFCAMIPADEPVSVTMNAADELVTIDLFSPLETLAPQAQKSYQYQLFYGPKKLSLLKETGFNLGKIIQFRLV